MVVDQPLREVGGTPGRKDTAFGTTGLEIILPAFAVIHTHNFSVKSWPEGHRPEGSKAEMRKNSKAPTQDGSTKGRLQGQTRDGGCEGYQGLAEGQSPLLRLTGMRDPTVRGYSGEPALTCQGSSPALPCPRQLLPHEAELDGSPKASRRSL